MNWICGFAESQEARGFGLCKSCCVIDDYAGWAVARVADVRALSDRPYVRDLRTLHSRPHVLHPLSHRETWHATGSTSTKAPTVRKSHVDDMCSVHTSGHQQLHDAVGWKTDRAWGRMARHSRMLAGVLACWRAPDSLTLSILPRRARGAHCPIHHVIQTIDYGRQKSRRAHVHTPCLCPPSYPHVDKTVNGRLLSITVRG